MQVPGQTGNGILIAPNIILQRARTRLAEYAYKQRRLEVNELSGRQNVLDAVRISSRQLIENIYLLLPPRKSERVIYTTTAPSKATHDGAV